jgi:hypothetical protein
VVHGILGGHWRGVPSPQQGSFKILLPFTASYLCETAFSAVAAIKTKWTGKTTLELPFKNSNLGITSYV